MLNFNYKNPNKNEDININLVTEEDLSNFNNNYSNDNGISSKSDSQSSISYLENQLNDLAINVKDKKYGAIGDGVKRTIKEVDPSVTLEEVKALCADATLDDQWDWYALQKAFNDLITIPSLFLPATPPANAGDDTKTYVISKPLTIPYVQLREIYGHPRTTILQIGNNMPIIQFKYEDTWGINIHDLYLKYASPQVSGNTKSIAICLNPDKSTPNGMYFLNFNNIRITNCYYGFAVNKENRPANFKCACWSSTFSNFTFKNCYCGGFDFNNGIGQPNITLRNIRCLNESSFINRAKETGYSSYFILAVATQLEINDLDLEYWTNGIFNCSGGGSLIASNWHIEHHSVTENYTYTKPWIHCQNTGFFKFNYIDISDVNNNDKDICTVKGNDTGTMIVDGLKVQVASSSKAIYDFYGNGDIYVNGTNYVNNKVTKSPSWIASNIKRYGNDYLELKINGVKLLSGSSSPNSAVKTAYNKGDIIYNNNPSPGGYVGWICIASGTPGTWKGFGTISK